MAGLNRDFVYVGIKGHIVALDVATGTERWRTKLRGSDFVQIATDGSRLFGAARGEIFCLDGGTGAILWHNKLAGMGMGFAGVLPGAGAAGEAQPMVAAARSRQQHAH